MIPYYGILLVSLLVALHMGLGGAKAIDANVRIYHDSEAMKAVFLVGFPMLVFAALHVMLGHFTGWCALWIPIAFGVYSPVERLTMNLSRKKLKPVWYYLGPHIRGPRESRYDGWFWSLCRKKKETFMFGDTDHVTYSTEGFEPGIAAYLFEITVLAGSSWLYLLHR